MIGRILFFLVGLPILDLLLLMRAGIRMGPIAFALVVGSGLAGLGLYKYYGSKLWGKGRSTHFSTEKDITKTFWKPISRWVAGLLLMFPGFLTDVLGVILLLPGAYKLLGQGFLKWMQKKFQAKSSPHSSFEQNDPFRKSKSSKQRGEEIKADWRIVDKQDLD